MILAVRELLVVEVVHVCDEAPRVFVFTPHARVGANGRFHREEMLPQALALHMLRHERPGAVPRQQRLRHAMLLHVPSSIIVNARAITMRAFSVTRYGPSAAGSTSATSATSVPA